MSLHPEDNEIRLLKIKPAADLNCVIAHILLVNNELSTLVEIYENFLLLEYF